MKRNLWIIGTVAVIVLGAAAVSFIMRPQLGDVVAFDGPHQAGVTTPQQMFVSFGAFDVTTRDRSQLRELLQEWTAAARRMSRGLPMGNPSTNRELPPADNQEVKGLKTNRLTFTFGAGPSLFDDRFGLANRRPEALVDLPHFAGDDLNPAWSGGDLGVQICSNDLSQAFHAMRSLVRLARGKAVLRWLQDGFTQTNAVMKHPATGRNLFGFKDGTVNPDLSDESLLDQEVWSNDGWMKGGTYLVVRRIRMRIEAWDRDTFGNQEHIFGRDKSSGAPLGTSHERSALPLNAKNADGSPVIAEDSHTRLAHGDGTQQILRRGYSYVNGLDPKTGQLDAGLLFIAFQKDPRTGFIPIQTRLAGVDAMNEYITHVGSAIFACFPGTAPDGFVGQTLFSN